jgi:hypothetical protein
MMMMMMMTTMTTTMIIIIVIVLKPMSLLIATISWQAWLRIWEFTFSNLNTKTGYPVAFRSFPPPPQPNSSTVLEIKPRPLPVIFFLIFSLMTMSLHKL